MFLFELLICAANSMQTLVGFESGVCVLLSLVCQCVRFSTRLEIFPLLRMFLWMCDFLSVL